MGKLKYKNVITKELLHKEYVDNRKSAISISNEINCDKSTIYNYLKLFNINRRTIGEALLGHVQSKETRIKISIFHKNNPVRHWLGKTHSDAYKQNMSIAMKGKIKTPEHIKNQAESLRKRKGGITPLHTLIRKCKKYRDWRVAVFERDNYTCQKCGIVGGILNAHHLYTFSNILKDFVSIYNNLNINKDEHILFQLSKEYKLFWDIDNGQTLCKDCHSVTKRKKLC